MTLGWVTFTWQAAWNMVSVGVMKMKASTFCSRKVPHSSWNPCWVQVASSTIMTDMKSPCERATVSMAVMVETGP